MSNTVAIHAEKLGKQYRIGERPRYRTLRDTIAGAFHRPSSAATKHIWALKDVSFDVQQGEVVGIIGSNGAGKSTLLKVLSRITEPTEGLAEVHGRIGSLLEVGTGFHPELTGRENIYLNGAILGMRKSEITRKFDEIVAFAETEQFLDTPVKHYSSGMQVRLAFAIAAHLEPEILLVDEVLAVGDAAFQKRCLGKMGSVASSGRTVLFVSHNIGALEALCPRSILLGAGRFLYSGSTRDALDRYREIGPVTGAIYHKITPVLRWLGLVNRNQLDDLSPDHDLEFVLAFETGDRALKNLYVDIALQNDRGTIVVHGKWKFVVPPADLPSGCRFHVHYEIESPKLAPGRYALTVCAYSGGEVLFWAEDIDACHISAKPYFGIVECYDQILSCILPKYAVRYEVVR